MANNANPKKVEAARILYTEGYTNIEIADIVGLNKHTIGKMADRENWAAIKLNKDQMETSAISNLMEVFVYQADCLKKQKDKKISEGDFMGFRAGDFDAMQKFYSVIRQDMKSYKMFARVITDLMQYLELTDIDMAQAIMPLVKEYLKQKQNALL